MKTLIDYHGHALKEYWFQFTSPEVTAQGKTFIDHLEALFPMTHQSRQRLMSSFKITEAITSKPFFISLNAILVITALVMFLQNFALTSEFFTFRELQRKIKEVI